MFCRNCGKEIIAGSNFCTECGFPNNYNITSLCPDENWQEEKVLPETNGQRKSAHTKKIVTILSLIAVAIVALVVLIMILMPSKDGRNTSEHGFDTPEEAAITYFEGLFFEDPNKSLSSMHPAMIDELSVFEISRLCAIYASTTVLQHYDCGKVRIYANDDEYCLLYEEAINNSFDADIEITALAKVECYFTCTKDGEQKNGDYLVPVVKIGERWYSAMDNRIDTYILYQQFEQ